MTKTVCGQLKNKIRSLYNDQDTEGPAKIVIEKSIRIIAIEWSVNRVREERERRRHSSTGVICVVTSGPLCVMVSGRDRRTDAQGRGQR